MSDINDGGPAFPHEYKFGDGTAARADGMTLRQWLAGQALVGEIMYQGLEGRDVTHIANMVCEMADALIAAEAKR